MVFNNKGLRLRGAILTILIGFLVWHMKMIKLRCVGGGGGGGYLVGSIDELKN